MKLYNTSIAALASGDSKQMAEAVALQNIGTFGMSMMCLISLSLRDSHFLTVSNADWCIVKAGIGGTKYALDHFIQAGLGGVPRKPLPLADEACKAMVDAGMIESIALENSL